MKYIIIFSLLFLFNNAFAATPFFADGGFTRNGIEWCEENYSLYKYMGDDFFEHHNHSIESRVCVSLILDSLWNYSGEDREEKLIEKSRYYVLLEIEESAKEAETGKIDTKPASLQDDVTQAVIQKPKEFENKQNQRSELENKTIDTTQNLINDTSYEDKNKGGGCLIATATYGSEMAPQVQFLREIRDNKLMNTQAGSSFMNGFNEFYYSFSPYIADYERENPLFKELVKIGITPMLSSLSILSLADSEQEVIGLGIGVILMNIGMYFVGPAMLFYKIK